MSYEDRLKEVHLPSLAFRRFREDIITTFKICNIPFLVSEIFEFKQTPTRGHIWSLYKTRTKSKFMKSSLRNRVFSSWNGLPDGLENFSLNQLKTLLDKHFYLGRYGSSSVNALDRCTRSCDWALKGAIHGVMPSSLGCIENQ